MSRGSGPALWPARDHDQFRGADGWGGSVPVAVDVLDVEAGENEGEWKAGSAGLPLE